MKKKILGILLVVAMSVSLLAGCGNNNKQTDASEKQEDTTKAEQSDAGEKQEDTTKVEQSDTPGDGSMEGKKVGFTVPSVGNDFMLSIVDTVKEALKAEGVSCQVDSADGDVTKQIEQIENYATMGMDMIVILPINGEALTSVCQKVMKEDKIPVFAYAMEIPDGATTQMLAAEEYDMGEACAQIANEWIEKTFPDAKDGEVNLYLLSSSYSPELKERCDGMRTIAENKKVTIIEEETADSNNSDEARVKIENAFLAHPEIDVVIAANGPSALGIESYMASSDCPVDDLSEFGIFTVDATEEIIAKIKASEKNESTLRGTISMGDIQDIVYNNFMPACAPILKGEEPIPVWNGTFNVVTVDTLKE